jgi:hypothetical protein
VSDADEIRADIAATRAQLADTADALAAKLDVKAQAGAKLHEAEAKANEKRPVLLAVGGALVLVLVLRRVRRAK